MLFLGSIGGLLRVGFASLLPNWNDREACFFGTYKWHFFIAISPFCCTDGLGWQHWHCHVSAAANARLDARSRGVEDAVRILLVVWWRNLDQQWGLVIWISKSQPAHFLKPSQYTPIYPMMLAVWIHEMVGYGFPKAFQIQKGITWIWCFEVYLNDFVLGPSAKPIKRYWLWIQSGVRPSKLVISNLIIWSPAILRNGTVFNTISKRDPLALVYPATLEWLYEVIRTQYFVIFVRYWILENPIVQNWENSPLIVAFLLTLITRSVTLCTAWKAQQLVAWLVFEQPGWWVLSGWLISCLYI
jgi:hypothetical protein